MRKNHYEKLSCGFAVFSNKRIRRYYQHKEIIYECGVVAGYEEGIGVMFNSEHFLTSIEIYKKGKKHGILSKYRTNGTLYSITMYENSRLMYIEGMQS
jgi:antitoxin component YwqK of YwqJK toxin-antitoxin module